MQRIINTFACLYASNWLTDELFYLCNFLEGIFCADLSVYNNPVNTDYMAFTDHIIIGHPYQLQGINPNGITSSACSTIMRT